MELIPFQIKASTQIADRCQKYLLDPLAIKRTTIVPFYQNLSAITGSGKTLILADAIEQIRSRLPLEPIVLWLSKGRVVVWQTFANLSTGKYAELLGGYTVKTLLDCKPTDVENSAQGLVLVATVGKFNQKDKSEGDRRIFQVGLDSADKSLWDMLKLRKDSKGRRRPFIVVYDEGHNLSDQQTTLLLELEPDALIAASATMRIPEAMAVTIDRLRKDLNWTDNDLVTAVRSSEVVQSGLVKEHIMLGGYVTPMESAVDEMVDEMARAKKAAEKLGLSFSPKAIYVSSTNVPDGTPMREDMARPFKQRMARPILIWRYLVEQKKVDPAEIAVYCDLKFEAKYPPPKSFILFAGGDTDYDRFKEGNFKHIIFNLSLQEGWDDSECCFAYIDKEMGSPDQVTQVVGRVLRQPGAQHYPPAILNTAHFYIRTDEKGVFEAILEDVKKKIAADAPDITLSVRRDTHGSGRSFRPALKKKVVPTAAVYSAAAKAPIDSLISKIQDFRKDTVNVIGKGGRIQILQDIGSATNIKEEWVDVAHSNRVTARWIFVRAIQKRHPKAVHLCDIEDPRFDAMVEYHSLAADHFRDVANKVVDAYIEHSVIVQHALDHPYEIDSVPVDESGVVSFSNAIHAEYSGLNKFEKAFALALDKTRKIWCRNPSQGAYGIPLLDSGNTRTFNPDFLVWTKDNVFAIDTKGDHLIVEDASRKLFLIDQVEPGPKLLIRLVTEGKWDSNFSKASGSTGYTVWTLKQGKVHPTHCKDEGETVQTCLKV